MNIDTAQFLLDLWWIIPELWLCLAGFILLGFAPFTRDAAGKRLIAWLSIAAQAVTLVLVFAFYAGVPKVFSVCSAAHPGAIFKLSGGAPLLVVDGFSLVLKAVVLTAGILASLMGLRYLEIEKTHRAEFHCLLLFAVLGGMFLVCSTDFISLFTALETMSLSVYLLVGWTKQDHRSNEAALKYFLLGAFAAGLLLYGMSLVYGASGKTNLFLIAEKLQQGLAPQPLQLLSIGLVFLVAGIGFKLAAAPFHMWTPDAYEGAPTNVTAFMSTAVKTAAFGMALRMFLIAFPSPAGAARWTILFAVLSAVSMTWGNIVALWQDNTKRLLAYSSIAHVGYALMGLVAVGAALSHQISGTQQVQAIAAGQLAVVLYMVAYTFTAAGAFGMVVLLRREGLIGDRVADFAGMARRSPWLAAAMMIFLLSLGGIPATAGFVGKWWLFASALQGGFAWLAILAALNTAISLFYYLRIVVTMYFDAPGDQQPYALAPTLTAALVLAVAGVLLVGLWPEPVLNLVRGAAQIP